MPLVKRVAVKLVNGQVPKAVRKLPEVEAEVSLSGGSALAQQIVDDQLRKVAQNLKSQMELDPDHVRTIREMTQVLESLSKMEREQRREDKFGDQLRNLTEEQLDAIIRGKK